MPIHERRRAKARGNRRSTQSPGESMVQLSMTVSVKPVATVAMRQAGLTGPRQRVITSRGPKAAASACQAKSTRLNIWSGDPMASQRIDDVVYGHKD